MSLNFDPMLLAAAGNQRGTYTPTTADWDQRIPVSASSTTHSSVSIGTASASRVVIIAHSLYSPSGTSFSISSVTIGGVAATYNGVAVNDGVDSSFVAGISYAVVPTGTTADVVVTFSGTLTGFSEVYVTTVDFGITGVTFTGTSDSTPDGSGVLTANPGANAAILVAAASWEDGSAGSITWTADGTEIESTEGTGSWTYALATFQGDTSTDNTITATPSSWSTGVGCLYAGGLYFY